MSELKPCPFCGEKAEIERIGTARQSTIYRCTICGCSLETGEEFNHGDGWNQRDDTPALIRGARIGLEMAAKRCSEYAYEVARKREGARAQHFMGAHVGAFGCAENIRLITDTDIMKEISREE